MLLYKIDPKALLRSLGIDLSKLYFFMKSIEMLSIIILESSLDFATLTSEVF